MGDLWNFQLDEKFMKYIKILGLIWKSGGKKPVEFLQNIYISNSWFDLVINL